MDLSVAETQRMEHLCLFWRQNSSGDEQAGANPRVLKDFMKIQGFFIRCVLGHIYHHAGCPEQSVCSSLRGSVRLP